MPIMNTADEEMDSTYKEAPEGEEPEVDSEEEEPQTLVSKDILPEGAKVGATYTFKVVADYGDEVGVNVVSEAEDDEEEEQETKSEEDSEIESMDTEED